MPGGAPTPPPITQREYMIAVNGAQYGPYNKQQLAQMAQAGQINAQTLVWTQGMAQWEQAAAVADLAMIFQPAAPGGMPFGTVPPPPVQ